MGATNSSLTSPESRRTERLSRIGILEEPMGYVDGQNLYQFVGSDPVSSVDPLGLTAETQPTTQRGNLTIEPVKFGDPVELPGPESVTDPNSDFYKLYIAGDKWGVTKWDGKWDDVGEDPLEFHGRVYTALFKLVLPKELPPCIDQAQREQLRKAVD